MAKITKGARMRNKIVTTPSAEPTIPQNDDHTTGWRTTDIYVGEFMLNSVDNRLWIRADDGVRETVVLDEDGLIPGALIPSNSSGAVTYRGTWDASTGFQPGIPPNYNKVKGDYYVVDVPGNTSLDGVDVWNVGDWAIYNGTNWNKLANTAYLAGDNIKFTQDAFENVIIDIVDNPVILGNLTVNQSAYVAQLGVGTLLPEYNAHIKIDANSITELAVENAEDEPSAGASLSVINNVGKASFTLYSDEYTPLLDWQNAAVLQTDAAILKGLVMYSNQIRFQNTQGQTDAILKSGNFGVGTGNSDPLSKFVVAKDSDTGYIEFRLGSNQANIRDMLLRKNTTAPFDFNIIAGQSADTPSDMYIYLKNSGDPIMTFKTTENIGFGIYDPEHFVHFYRDQNEDTKIVIENNDSGVVSRASVQVKSDIGSGFFTANSSTFTTYPDWDSAVVLYSEATMTNGLLLYSPNILRFRNTVNEDVITIIGNNVGFGGFSNIDIPQKLVHIRRNQDSDTFLRIENENNTDSSRVGLELLNDTDSLQIMMMPTLYTDNGNITNSAVITYEAVNNPSTSKGLILHSNAAIKVQNTIGTEALSIKGNKVAIGIDEADEYVQIYKNQNNSTYLHIENDNSGNLATTGIKITNFAGRTGYIFTTNNSYDNVTEWANSYVFSTNPIGASTSLTGGMIFHTPQIIGFQNHKGVNAFQVYDNQISLFNGDEINYSGVPSASIGTQEFVPGFTGTGMKIYKDYASEWNFETDNMTLRGTLSVYELLIQQIRATNGNIMVASTGKVAEIIDGTRYSEIIEMDDPQGHGASPFAENDIIICQRVELGGTSDPDGGTTDVIKRHIRRVVSFTGTTIALTQDGDMPSDGSSSEISAGDEFVRLGNTTDLGRQGGVYLTADESNAPYIDVFAEVNSWTAWKGINKLKARLGRLDQLTDLDAGLSGSQTNYWGLYSNNVHLTGHLNAQTGKIGDFWIDSGSIRNTAQTLYINDDYNRFVVLKNSVDPSDAWFDDAMNTDQYEKVEMFAGSDLDWGLRGIIDKGGTKHTIFELGSTNQIAQWYFDEGVLWSGGQLTQAISETGAGIELNSQVKRITAHIDNNNYIGMYFDTTGNWGLRGKVDSNTVFHLGYETNNMYNIIASWNFDYDSLWSGNKSGSGLGGIELNATNKIISVHETGTDYIRMYYTNTSDWGLNGVENGQSIFHLGANSDSNIPNNHIANWEFDNYKLYSTNSLYGITLSVGTPTEVTKLDAEVKVDVGSITDASGTTTTDNFVRLFSKSDGTVTWGIQGVIGNDSTPDNSLFYLGMKDNSPFNKIAKWYFDENKLWSLNEYADNAPGVELDAGEQSIKVYKNTNNFVEIYYEDANDWGIKGNTDVFGTPESIFRLGNENRIAAWNFDGDRLYSLTVSGLTEYGLVLDASNRSITAYYDDNININKVGLYFQDTDNWGLEGDVDGIDYFHLGERSTGYNNHIAGWQFDQVKLFNVLSNKGIYLQNTHQSNASLDYGRGLNLIDTSVAYGYGAYAIRVGQLTNINTKSTWNEGGYGFQALTKTGASTYKDIFRISSADPYALIASWYFDEESLWSGDKSGSGLSGIELNSINKYFSVHKTLNDYVKVYYTDTNNWGIEGKENNNIVFKLGSENKISAFNFDDTELTSVYTIPEQPSDRDGTFFISTDDTVNTISGSNGLVSRGLGMVEDIYGAYQGDFGKLCSRIGRLQNLNSLSKGFASGFENFTTLIEIAGDTPQELFHMARLPIDPFFGDNYLRGLYIDVTYNDDYAIEFNNTSHKLFKFGTSNNVYYNDTTNQISFRNNTTEYFKMDLDNGGDIYLGSSTNTEDIYINSSGDIVIGGSNNVRIIMDLSALPTVDTGVVGSLWRDGTTLKITTSGSTPG